MSPAPKDDVVPVFPELKDGISLREAIDQRFLDGLNAAGTLKDLAGLLVAATKWEATKHEMDGGASPGTNGPGSALDPGGDDDE